LDVFVAIGGYLLQELSLWFARRLMPRADQNW
jgi:hypothetical protein